MRQITDLYNVIPEDFKLSEINITTKRSKLSISINPSILHLDSIREICCYMHYLVSSGHNAKEGFYENFIAPLRILILFIEKSPYLIGSFLSVSEDVFEIYKDFITLQGEPVYKRSGKKDSFTRYIAILDCIFSYLIDKYDDRTGFERDIWHLDQIKISPSRKNPARPINTMTFYEIKNEVNKGYLKKYLKFRILNTKYALSTILTDYSTNKRFILFLGSINLQDMTQTDTQKFLESENLKLLKDRSYNIQIYRIISFQNFLLERMIILLFFNFENEPSRLKN
jgi:hypothetical protein